MEVVDCSAFSDDSCLLDTFAGKRARGLSKKEAHSIAVMHRTRLQVKTSAPPKPMPYAAEYLITFVWSG